MHNLEEKQGFINTNDIKPVLIIYHFSTTYWFCSLSFMCHTKVVKSPRIWWGATYHLSGFSWPAHATRGASFIVAWFGSGKKQLWLVNVDEKIIVFRFPFRFLLELLCRSKFLNRGLLPSACGRSTTARMRRRWLSTIHVATLESRNDSEMVSPTGGIPYLHENVTMESVKSLQIQIQILKKCGTDFGKIQEPSKVSFWTYTVYVQKAFALGRCMTNFKIGFLDPSPQVLMCVVWAAQVHPMAGWIW